MDPEQLQAMLLTPPDGVESVAAPVAAPAAPMDDAAGLQAALLQPPGSPDEGVPAPMAMGAPAAPQPQYSADGRVYVLSRAGELGTVDAAELPALGSQGFSLAGQDAIGHAMREAEFGTLGQQVITGLEGTAQGATLGGYGLVAGAVAGDEYDQRRRAREEINPLTSVGTQVLGAVIPALASGGAGALGTAARFVPAGLEASLGAKLATSLGSKAAAWSLGKAGQIGARAIATGIEGAADQAIRTVLDDAANGDVEVTAERMTDSLWDGLALGAGFELGGAAVGALARATGRGAQRMAGALGDMLPSRRAAGALADAAPTPSVVGMDPVAAQDVAGPLRSSQLPDPERGLGSDLYAKARAAEGAFEDGQQGAVRTIRKDLDGLLKDVDQVDTLASIGAKRKAAEVFDGHGRGIDPAEFKQVLDRSRASIDELVAEHGEVALQTGAGLGTLKQVKSIINGGEKQIAKHLAAGDLGSAYMVADDVKRAIGKGQGTKNKVAQGKLREVYEDWRQFMENEDLFGELAQKQKAVNPAWSERIRRQQDGSVGGFFTRSGEAAEDPFEALKRTNDASVGGLLNQLGKAESEGTEEALRRYLRSTAIDAENRAAAWGTPELQEAATRIKAAAAKIEDSMNAVALLKRDSQGWAKAKKAVEGIPFAGAAMNAASSIAQKADAIGMNPLGMVAARAPAEVPIGVVGKLTDDAVKAQERIVRHADSAVKAILGEASKRTTHEAAAQAINVVERATNQAAQLQIPASNESRELDRQVAELSAVDPALGQALRDKVMNRAAFINSKVTPSIDPSDPLGMAPGQVDAATWRKNNRYVVAAMNPQAALKRLSDGTGTPEDLETLKALTPRLYETFTKRVLERVQKAKKPPSIGQRQRLGYLLGMPMDRASTADSIAFFQSLVVPEGGQSENPNLAPAQPKSKRTTNDSRDNVYASRTDQIMDGS